MTKNLKKFTAKRKLNFFGLKTTIYLSLGLHKRTSTLQKKPSALKREHPALQNIYALLDPDPDPESGYGSTDLIESGSETLPMGTFCDKKTLNWPTA